MHMLLGNLRLLAPTSYVARLPSVKGIDKRVFEVGHVLNGSIRVSLIVAWAPTRPRKVSEACFPNLIHQLEVSTLWSIALLSNTSNSEALVVNTLTF